MKRTFDGQPIAVFGGELGSTKILDLNDDCLRECFEYFNLMELTDVADACSRFRRIAQTHFRTTKYKRLDTSDIREEGGMLGVSKVLRNFGASVVAVGAWPGPVCPNYCMLEPTMRSECLSKIVRPIIKLICRYCDDHLEELELVFSTLEDDLAQAIQPLISQLKRLYLNVAAQHSDIILKLLPMKNYLKLEDLRMTLRYVDLDAFCTDQVLAKTPHLKKLEIQSPKAYEGFFQSVAKHLPLIENIQWDGNRKTCATLVNTKYLGDLSKLNTLAIFSGFRCSNSNFYQALTAMAANGVPLKHLKLNSIDLTGHIQQCVESISKFKNLKSLVLFQMYNISASNLFDILRNLNELVELKLYCTVVPVTKETLLKLMSIANKLQNFYYVSHTYEEMRCDIDEDTFLKMVNIVEERREKTHLTLFLSERVTDVSVSASLVRAYTDTITITLLNNGCYFWADVLDSRDLSSSP